MTLKVLTIVGVSILVYYATYWLEYACRLLFRAPVALDSERQKEIGERDETIRRLGEKPKRKPDDEHYYQEAKGIVDRLSPEAKQLLRHIKKYEKLEDQEPHRRHGEVPGLTVEQVNSLLSPNGELTHPTHALIHQQYERKGHLRVWWEIVPAYKTALGKLLYVKEA